MAAVYGVCCVLSILTILYLAQKNYQNIDIYYWSIVVIMPFITLGYWIVCTATDKPSAMLGYVLEYLDSCVMSILMLFSMYRSLGVKVNRFIKTAVYAVGFAHICLVWFCRNTTLYYSSLIIYDDVGTVVTDGPLKFIHYIYLTLLGLAMVSAIVRGFVKRGTYSRRILVLYALFTVLSLLSYAIEIIFEMPNSLLPILYVVADIVIAFNYDHAHSHDIDNLITEQRKSSDTKGFIAFDMKKRLLSYNEQAAKLIPALSNFVIDEKIDKEDPELAELFNGMIDKLEKHIIQSSKFEIKDRICDCEVSYFSPVQNGKAIGYLFEIHDITEQQHYLKLVEEYNQRLNEEVDKKTKNIANIQQKVVLGLANMIEDRDQNTGGHVKRTSDTVAILVEEIQKTYPGMITGIMAKDIVRAAPMHDLGKIIIDSSILCKPAKLNSNEYKIMQSHSSKSGEVVKSILQGVEEQHFVDTAYALARFHHEHWDGTGYPEGLSGENIPLAARIMTVADVYDALVSKRCYKEPMSFDEAFNIMMDGMGTQFDPKFKKILIDCREKLEDYYRKQR